MKTFLMKFCKNVTVFSKDNPQIGNSDPIHSLDQKYSLVNKCPNVLAGIHK